MVRVGPSGGTATIAGVTIVVPPGAVSQDVEVRLIATTTPAPSSYVGYTALFRLEPLDLTFSGTITVTLDFPIGAEAPKVYMSVPGDPTRFEEVPSTIVGGKLQVNVSRLGVFFVGRSLVDGGASDAAVRDGNLGDSMVPDATSDSSADSAVADATVVDATAVDAAVVDATVVDAAVVDATVVDATVVDATVDAAVVDSGHADACTAESNQAFCGRLQKTCGHVVDTDNCGVTRDVADCGPCALNQTCDTTNRCTLPTYTLGGVVSGLAGSGLVLSLSGTEALPRTSNGSYTFAKALDNGSSYIVVVQGQPTNPWQTCTTTNAVRRPPKRVHHDERGHLSILRLVPLLALWFLGN